MPKPPEISPSDVAFVDLTTVLTERLGLRNKTSRWTFKQAGFLEPVVAIGGKDCVPVHVVEAFMADVLAGRVDISAAGIRKATEARKARENRKTA